MHVPERSRRGASLAAAPLLLAWATVVITGLAGLARYRWRAGAAGETATPVVWPESADLPRDISRPSLIMFVHPRCPCSKASIHELATLLAKTPSKLSVQVQFAILPGMDAGEFSPLWKEASAIPGVQVVADPDGTRARQFGATTSGQVALYGKDGRLLFSGGITDGRGHEGDNAGLSEALLALRTPDASPHTTPVYGCPLLNAATRNAAGGQLACPR